MPLISDRRASAEATVSTTRVLVVILSVVIVLPLSVAGTSVLLPPIARDLGATPVLLQWVVNGFNVSFALSTLVWGAVADRFGLKRTFLLNAAILAIGSLVSALAPTLPTLDIFRAIAGAGAGAIQVAAAALISTTFSGPARAKAFGMLGTVLGVGLAFGPTISGLMSSMLGWRSVFLLPLLPLILALAMHASLPADSARLQAITDTDFGTVGHRPSSNVLRDMRFLAICVITVLQAIGFISLLTYLPTAFSAVWGLTEGATGAIMLVLTAPVLLLPAFGARLVARPDRTTAFGVFYTALILIVAGNAVLLIAVEPDAGIIPVLIAMVLLGASFGLPLGVIDGEALACAPPSRQGRAAGVLNFVRISSEAVAVAIYGIALATVVGSVADNDTIAARVITGAADRPDWYAEAFRTLQVGVVATTLALSLLVLVLHLRALAPSRHRIR